MRGGRVWTKWWSSKSGREVQVDGTAAHAADIASLNRVAEDVSVIPNYTPKLEHRRVDFYYADHDQVLIAGVSDNNYIFWLSRTRLDDAETNKAVFDYISCADPTMFAHLDAAARKLGYGSEQLRSFYRDSLVYVGGEDPAPDDQVWRTPFGVRYIKSEEKNNGSYFASGIKGFRYQLERRCAFREAEGRYLEVMRWNLATLRKTSGDPVDDYESKRQLIELIHEERYLLCSDNEEVRKLYLQLDRECSQMYNAYMSIVR